MAEPKIENRTGDIETLYDIRQEVINDKGGLDFDCGPTCALFLRYGGGSPGSENEPPREGPDVVTHENIGEMCRVIRQQVLHQGQEEAATSDRKEGLNVDKVALAVGEFAPVHDRFIYQGNFAPKWIDSTDKNEDEILAEIVQRLNSCLAHDPRGVVVPVYYRRNWTAREAKEGGEDVFAHVVVYLGPYNETADMYDPGEPNPQQRFKVEWALMDLAFAHYWWCTDVQKAQTQKIPWRVPPPDNKTFDQGFTSYLVHGSKVPGSPDETQKNRSEGSPYILAGDALGEIDMNNALSTTWGEDLIAQENATYYYSYKTADMVAETLSETTSVAVIECPEGLFAVVPVNDLGTDLVTGESNVDRSGSADSFFNRNWTEGMASLSLLLAYEEDGDRKIHKTTPPLIMGDSHRNNY